MADDDVTIGSVHARAIAEGQVVLALADGTDCQVLVPAGVGVPGASDEEFAAALAAELVAVGRSLPAVLDSSAVVSSDPAVYAATVRRLEDHWARQL